MAIDTSALTSRRSLLVGALGGTAAAIAASVAGAQRVLAAGSDGTPILVAGIYDDATDTTRIVNNTNVQPAFRVGNNQGGTGLEAFSGTGTGVLGSGNGIGVRGFTNDGKGVQADCYGATAMGVHSLSHSVAGTTYSVLSEAWSPAGLAVLGNNYATTGHAQGVQGTSDSPQGYASTGWARHGGTGIVGASGPTFPNGSVPANTGVYGYGQTGRGGVFQGKAAQVRLVPSTATSHPASGAAGDLFLDKSRRLWLCKGGATWKLIA